MQKKIEYPLHEILMAAFLAVVAGAATFVDMAEFGRLKEKWLKDNFGIKHGIPSHDTFRRVLSIINPVHLQSATVSFLVDNIKLIKRAFGIEPVGPKQYCVDGKTSKGTGRLKGTEREVKQLQTLHVYDRGDGICITSKAISDKSNEIPAAQEILRLMDLRGAVVSFDALNTQRETVAAIVGQKGDYVAALKGNHPELFSEVLSYFTPARLARLESSGANFFKAVEKKHNRVETRKYYLTRNVSWLVQAGEWAGLRSLVYYTIHTEDINTAKTTDEKYAFIASVADVMFCADVIRGHWAVENLLHFHLDVNFMEDDIEIIDRVTYQNMSLLNKMALSLTKIIAPILNKSIRLTRKHIGWNINAIVKLFCVLDEDILSDAIANVKA